jgi:ERI1 exoribonuclease 3
MDSEYTHAIILDFEATCDDRNQPRPQEIVEFPSVLISLESLETVAEFRSFVRPYHHPVLTEFCAKFNSVSQADVDSAGTFPEVLVNHQAWLDDYDLSEENGLFVTCGDWDLGMMLLAQCLVAVSPVEVLRPIYTRWQNVKRAFCFVRNRLKAPGMAAMLKDLGLPLTGHHHRGIDDCRNIAELYKALLQSGATADVTAELPISKYPPVTIRFRLGDRVELVKLTRRTIQTLRSLAARTFKCRISEFYRKDGNLVSDDRDLLSLTPGEEIRVT